MKVLAKKDNGLYDIEYYDKIHKEKVKLTDVSEDVVKFFKKQKKYEERQTREWKRHCVSLELLQEHGFDLDDYDEEDEDTNPEYIYLEKEQMEFERNNRTQLAVNMRKLTPKQREVIIMHFYKGMSLNEIAYALKIDYDSVIDRLNRAKDRLNENIFPPSDDKF